MNVARALGAADLPARWRGRERCVIIGVGAASAPILQAVVDAWRSDPARCGWLHVVLAAPTSTAGVDGRSASGADWAMRRTDDEHLEFLHVPAPTADALRELVARADVLFMASPPELGAIATAGAAARAWSAGCARLTASEACLVAETPSGPLQAALAGAGFVQAAIPGAAAMDASCVPYRRDTRVPVRIAAAWQAEDAGDRHAVVVGGGLAGCASAWALAVQGWHCTLLEAAAGLGGTAAAQPSAVFHPVMHAQDTRHARWARAAAQQARTVVEVACSRHGARGAADGLLHLIDHARSSNRTVADTGCRDRMRMLDAAAASDMAGTPIARAAWWQTDAGWVEPHALARSFLERGGASVHVRFGVHVEAIERADGAWRLLDRAGRMLAEANTVVLANAADAFRLLGGSWPVTRVRGQSSVVRSVRSEAPPLPRLPLAGGGYVAPTGDGGFVFGATSQPDDTEPAVRRADHVANLERLFAMAPQLARRVDVDALEGRVGWRCVARDRLPVVGRVPDAAGLGRHDVARLVPRRPGLFVHAALGSRGVAWCALGAQVLAALATGTPVPLPADLLEAIDPARFDVRDRRRAASANER